MFLPTLRLAPQSAKALFQLPHDRLYDAAQSLKGHTSGGLASSTSPSFMFCAEANRSHICCEQRVLNTHLRVNRQPTNRARGHVPCKEYRGSKSVRMCVSFHSPMRLACASVYLRIGGVGRERFRPTCPTPTIHPYSTCAPHHMRVTAKGRRWKVAGPLGFPFMDDHCHATAS